MKNLIKEDSRTAIYNSRTANSLFWREIEQRYSRTAGPHSRTARRNANFWSFGQRNSRTAIYNSRTANIEGGCTSRTARPTAVRPRSETEIEKFDQRNSRTARQASRTANLKIEEPAVRLASQPYGQSVFTLKLYIVAESFFLNIF